MPLAVRCPECGRVISSAREGAAGGCPFCLALVALNHADTPDPSHPSTSGAAVPEEVLKAGPSARLGKYVRVAKLGAGGMGEVWKAWDTELERWVALKLLRHEDPRELERFTREARTAAALSHPNIAAVYEAGVVAERHYIAMQLVVGRTLDRWVRGERRQVVTLVRDAARAVGFAHKHGVVHRDLKPTNLMVAADESGPHIFVMDFGLARKIEGGAKLSGTGTLAGTPAYMSPEQTRGRLADARSDVYSLGVTLYELLTGRPPFESDDLYVLLRKITDADPAPPRILDRKIDRDLDTIVLKCLEKDPARRYPTADALSRDLDHWLGGELILARPIGAIHRIGRKLAKRKAVVAAALSAVVISSLLAWWFLVGSPQGKHLHLMSAAMNDWAELLRWTGAGRDPEGTIKKARKAREGFEKAIEARETAQAQLMRGRCFQLEGLFGEALEALERAHELDAHHAAARIELTKVLLSNYQESRCPVELTLAFGNQGLSVQPAALAPETHEQQRWRDRGEQLLSAGGGSPAQESLLKGLLAFGKGEFSVAAKALGDYTEEESWDVLMIFHQGACLFAMKDYKGAIAIFDQSLARLHHDGSYQWRALAKYHLGLGEEAIKDLASAIEMSPKNTVHHINRGILLERMGRYDEAIADFTKAIDLSPTPVASLLWHRGRIRCHKGLFDDAIVDLTRAVEMVPKCQDAHCSRGLAKAAQGRFDEAIADYNEYIKFNTKFWGVWVNRGTALSALGRKAEALQDFRRAVAEDPQNAEPWYDLGLECGLQGMFGEAITALSKSVQLDPNHARAWSSLGLSRKSLGLLDDALIAIARAVNLEPKVASHYHNRGSIRQAMGLLAEAITDFNEALDLEPNRWGTLHARGTTNCMLGHYDEGIEDLLKSITLNPRFVEAWHGLGVAYIAKGTFDDAAKAFSKAIDLDSNNDMRWYTLGTVKMTHMELFGEAIEDLTKAIALNPRRADAYLNRGIAKGRIGRVDDAIDDFTLAGEHAPDDPKPWNNRGWAHLFNKAYDKATEDFEKAMTLSPRGSSHRVSAEEGLKRVRAAPLIQSGKQLCSEKKYREAIAKFKEVVDGNPDSQLAAHTAYDVACCYALLGEKVGALDWFEKAVVMGYKNIAHMEKDSDLDSLRTDERFKKLVERLKRESSQK